MKRLMIYGATGYTGRMVAEHAVAAGTPVVLAGRDDAKLAALAARLKVSHRTFTLDDSPRMDAALADVAAVLNCAGPFLRTAEVLMRAAIRRHVHYLDVSAELDTYTLAEALDREAAANGVMLLPGSGGSVAMLGCLAAHAVDRVPHPARIRLALQVAGPMSRGSLISAAGKLSAECLIRRDSVLVRQEPADLQSFDFGDGAVGCIPITLPDLVTVWHATHVPDIETFVHVSGSGFPQGDLADLPEGPTAAERDANRYRAMAEVTGADGAVFCTQLETVNGYSFTAMAAAEAGRRVLLGEQIRGFQTPAGLFGKSFVETIGDSRIIEISSEEADEE